MPGSMAVDQLKLKGRRAISRRWRGYLVRAWTESCHSDSDPKQAFAGDTRSDTQARVSQVPRIMRGNWAS